MKKVLIFFVLSSLSMAALGGSIEKPEREPKLVRSDYAPGELTKLCNEAIQNTEVRLNNLIKNPEKKKVNPLLEMENILADFSDDTTSLIFMGSVSTDEAISAEGSACEAKAGEYNVTVSARRDLYHLLDNAKPRNADEARLLEKTLESFRTSGTMLNDEKLAKVTDLNKRLSVLKAQFSANLNKSDTVISLSPNEIDGLSQNYIDLLKKNSDGNFIVTTHDTDFIEVMDNGKNPEARKKMLFALFNLGGDANTKIEEEAIAVRNEIAVIMGFSTRADFITSTKMAKNKENVLTFLNGLKDKLARKNKEDHDQLLAFKRESIPSAVQLDPWDYRYYTKQLKKRDFAVDEEKVREYFPTNLVIKGLFHVYEAMLGINIREIPNAKTWYKEVKLYEIRNRGGQKAIAYFYTDFVPRKGKTSGAAAYNLIGGRELSDGTRAIPVSAIVANFTAPGNGKPSLLNHDEVETVFHEFGHIMHQTLTRAPYLSLSGSNVAMDFVEAPSQMLENWVWSPQILGELSGHYLRPEEKLPMDMLNRLVASQKFQKGAFYTGQLLYALFDMAIHTQRPPVDTKNVYARLHSEIKGYEVMAGTNFPASFSHLMNGYDAGYYGYLWSQVYAEDMFTKFPPSNLMDAKTGAHYRKTILERGNMEEPIELLRRFLGREPNSEAFFKKLGI